MTDVLDFPGDQTAAAKRMAAIEIAAISPAQIAHDLRDQVAHLRALQRHHGPDCKGHPASMGHELALHIADLLDSSNLVKSIDRLRDAEHGRFIRSVITAVDTAEDYNDLRQQIRRAHTDMVDGLETVTSRVATQANSTS